MNAGTIMEENRRLNAFFNPRSAAIISATKKIEKAGNIIFKNFAYNKQEEFSKGKFTP